MSPSSRRRTGNYLPAAVGVDTVAVSMPCSVAAPIGSLSWNTSELVDPATGEIHRQRTSERLELGPGFFNPRFVEGSRLGSRVELEFSVPRWLEGNNNAASSVERVREALEGVGALLLERYDIAVDVEATWLRRVDLVRDFSGATNAQALLRGLSRLAPAHPAIKTALHTAPVAGREQPSCLVRGTTEYVGRLYDKTLESAQGPAPAGEGRVRFELQLRRSLVTKKGLRSLQGLETAPVDELARSYFYRFAFHHEVLTGGMEAVLRRIGPDLSAQDRKQLPAALGLEVLRQFDVRPSVCGKTLKRHEALLERLGLLIPVAGGGDLDTYCLNFDTGVAS